jgi:hypothetical protein
LAARSWRNSAAVAGSSSVPRAAATGVRGVLVANGRIYTLSPLPKGWLSNTCKKGDSKQLRVYAELIKKEIFFDKLGIFYL